MVIVKLQGGLGNQMFQYAAGRALAERLNTDLKLDITYYQKNKLRKYKLNNFCIKEIIANKEEMNQFYFKGIKKVFSFLTNPQNILLTELSVTFFCKKFFEVKNNVFLIGYFQSEEYFKSIESFIRNEFQLKEKLNKQSVDELTKIENTNSVSIHIRRGDYINNPKVNEIHGVCSLNYYKNAIMIIKEHVNKPHLFIFSDDIDWVKQNLIIDSPISYINFNQEERDFEDIYLMSSCRHNIIANSSFSWWGAWLNKNKEKIIIAPKNWFRTISMNSFPLIPNTWKSIL
jgi:hypothetical protein